MPRSLAKGTFLIKIHRSEAAEMKVRTRHSNAPRKLKSCRSFRWLSNQLQPEIYAAIAAIRKSVGNGIRGTKEQIDQTSCTHQADMNVPNRRSAI